MFAPFEIWLRGGNYSIRLTEVEPLVPELEVINQIAKCPFKGIDNPLVTLNYIQFDKEIITYGVGTTQFRTHYVLNKTDAVSNGRAIALKLGVLPLTALSLSVTSDGYVVFGERSSRTVSSGSFTLLPGGYMHPSHRHGSELSLEAVIEEELGEELGLPKENISSCCSTGLVFSNTINRGFVSAHITTVRADSSLVKSNYECCHDSETSGILFVKSNDTDIIDFVIPRLRTFSNHALGVLLCSGRLLYGDDFYKRLIRGIQSELGSVIILFDDTFATPGKTVKSTIELYSH
jgi:hypothetical protein